jgi:cytochrome oxidase Cu insertion factor (SCO1/SenC/PrrC family)
MTDEPSDRRAAPLSEPRAQLVTSLRKRNLRTVGALAALFFLPVLMAFWMYYGGTWRPASRTNHGELIEPARPLPQAELRTADGNVAPRDVFTSKWALIYIGDGACDEVCKTTLYFMRQTRLSLNNEMTRVSRVFLATAQCCNREFLEREHPGLLVLDAAGPEATELLKVFPVTDRAHSLFITDPLGNLVMRYDARENPKGLLEDLKKLLKLSHIG